MRSTYLLHILAFSRLGLAIPEDTSEPHIKRFPAHPLRPVTPAIMKIDFWDSFLSGKLIKRDNCGGPVDQQCSDGSCCEQDEICCSDGSGCAPRGTVCCGEKGFCYISQEFCCDPTHGACCNKDGGD